MNKDINTFTVAASSLDYRELLVSDNSYVIGKFEMPLDKANKDVVPTEWISHAEILKLIGEISGICLESKENCVVVYLEICGQKIEIIRDYATNICHNITRLGIASELAKNLKK